MAENYEILENPVYDPEIRKLQDSDPALATGTFNPLMKQMINNTHAVKLEVDKQRLPFTYYGSLEELGIAEDAGLPQLMAAMADGGIFEAYASGDSEWDKELPAAGWIKIRRVGTDFPVFYLTLYGAVTGCYWYGYVKDGQTQWKQDTLQAEKTATTAEVSFVWQLDSEKGLYYQEIPIDIDFYTKDIHPIIGIYYTENTSLQEIIYRQETFKRILAAFVKDEETLVVWSKNPPGEIIPIIIRA